MLLFVSAIHTIDVVTSSVSAAIVSPTLPVTSTGTAMEPTLQTAFPDEEIIILSPVTSLQTSFLCAACRMVIATSASRKS